MHRPATEAELEAVVDLGLIEEPKEDWMFPIPEPAPMHTDCVDPRAKAGYSDLSPASFVVPLDRKRYPTYELALARFEQLKELRGLKEVRPPFHTAQFWCWRVVSR